MTEFPAPHVRDDVEFERTWLDDGSWVDVARGWLAGRPFVTPDEVKAVVKPCLRHRLQLRPELELEGATVDGVLDGVLAATRVPR